MTPAEAKAALNGRPFIRVRTRSGCEYEVYWDTIECCDDYVYGFRVNGQDGPFRKTARNGAVKWFSLANATIIED